MQPELFKTEGEKNPHKEFLQRQWERLGDMIGDGLHREKDGGWISREYNRIGKILHPDIYKEMREVKSESVNKQMKELLEKSKCHQEGCSGSLVQARSGSKVAYCSVCNTRYKARQKKKK